jgi:hypothetical protein
MVKQKYGRIINISSGHVFDSYSDFGIVPYSIAKAGVIGLTKCLALAGRRHNISVNAAMPAALDTGSNRAGWNISTEEINKLKKIASAKEVAQVVAWLAQDDLFCNGEMFSVCRDNVTRVFIADSKGHRHTDFDSIGDCIKQTVDEENYRVPCSGGDFFGAHLGVAATHELSMILKKRQFPSTDPRG